MHCSAAQHVTAQRSMTSHSAAHTAQRSTAQRSAAQRSSYAGLAHTFTCAVQDPNLRHTLQFGIGMHHAGLTDGDRTTCERLFVAGKIQILVATSTLAWGVNTPAHLVVIKGTEYFDAPSRCPWLLAIPSCLLPDAILQMLDVHNCCVQLDVTKLCYVYVDVICVAVLLLRDNHQDSVTGRTSLQTVQHHMYR